MSSKVVQEKQGVSGADKAKFVIAGVLVAAGVFVFYWFQNELNGWLRTAAVIAGLLLGAGVFMMSSKGPVLREFFAETRFELRKVVWPTRQETMQMTWIVMVSVVVISLLLGGFDFVISKLLALLWR